MSIMVDAVYSYSQDGEFFGSRDAFASFTTNTPSGTTVPRTKTVTFAPDA